MSGILEALEMAQQRNKERDLFNAERRTPVLPIIPTNNVEPIELNLNVDGDGPPIDTRTPHEMYLDAIAVNQSPAIGMPVLGTTIGAINDAYIEDYERKNPDKVTGGGINKYSMLGRAMGRGLTPEQRVQSRMEGLGISKQFEPGKTPPGYSLLDRLTGNVPIDYVTQGDYIGSFPEQQISDDDGTEGGPIGGYRQEDLSFDSFAGPVGYA